MPRSKSALSANPLTVTGSAPLLNTDNPQIGRTVDNAEITDLPIVNRNVHIC